MKQWIGSLHSRISWLALFFHLSFFAFWKRAVLIYTIVVNKRSVRLMFSHTCRQLWVSRGEPVNSKAKLLKWESRDFSTFISALETFWRSRRQTPDLCLCDVMLIMLCIQSKISFIETLRNLKALAASAQRLFKKNSKKKTNVPTIIGFVHSNLINRTVEMSLFDYILLLVYIILVSVLSLGVGAGLNSCFVFMSYMVKCAERTKGLRWNAWHIIANRCLNLSEEGLCGA